ncbi:hypothetical protein ACF0H5_015853 [Mactra antiquata]
MGYKYKYLAAVAVLCIAHSAVEGKECLKNSQIGRRENNIYNCDDPYYPECCEVNREFTCCEEKLSKTLREQLQLWGTVAIFILLLYIVYLYFCGGSFCSLPCADSCKSCVGWINLRRNNHELHSNKYMRENTETQQIMSTSVKKVGLENPAFGPSTYFSNTKTI